MTLLRRWASIPPGVVLAILVAAFVALSVGEMVGQSCTFDEGMHLAAGYTYVRTGDFRMNPEHPPLVKILCALPLAALPVTWPQDPALWDSASQWPFAYRLIYESSDPDRILFWSRLAALPWGILLVLSVYAVAAERFGPRPALAAALLASFCPTLLAHAHLVTTDVSVALFFLLAAASFRSLFETGRLRWAVYGGFMVGGALAAKFSGVLIVPALALMALAEAVRRRLAPRPPGPPRPAILWMRRGATLLLISLIAIGTVWGVYGFQFETSPDGSYTYARDFRQTRESAVAQALRAARDAQLLPEPYLNGFGSMYEDAQRRTAYAGGRRSDTGWWWYFPYALLVKTPASALLLLGGGVLLAIRRARAAQSREDFLLIPCIVYGVVVLTSNLNIGVRHVLPLLPFLFVLAAGLPFVRESGRRWAAPAVLSLLALTPLESLASGPYFLTYFNPVSLAFSERRAMLIDSNLDWGQDLARLKRFMDRNGITEIKLAYTGSASPRRLGLRHQRLPSFNVYSRFESEWPLATELRPGDVVAAGATPLALAPGDDRERIMAPLEELKPFAVVGNSIFLYRIPEPPGR